MVKGSRSNKISRIFSMSFASCCILDGVRSRCPSVMFVERPAISNIDWVVSLHCGLDRRKSSRVLSLKPRPCVKPPADLIHAIKTCSMNKFVKMPNHTLFDLLTGNNLLQKALYTSGWVSCKMIIFGMNRGRNLV